MDQEAAPKNSGLTDVPPFFEVKAYAINLATGASGMDPTLNRDLSMAVFSDEDGHTVSAWHAILVFRPAGSQLREPSAHNYVIEADYYYDAYLPVLNLLEDGLVKRRKIFFYYKQDAQKHWWAGLTHDKVFADRGESEFPGKSALIGLSIK